MADLSVLDAASDAPNGIAFVHEGRTTTYRKAAALVTRAMHDLQRADVRRNASQTVAFLATPDLPHAVLLLALTELGIRAVPIHPSLTGHETESLLQSLPKTRLVSPDPDWMAGSEDIADSRPVSDDVPLAVLFTGGSTGSPKGVELSRGAFRAAIAASAQHLGWHTDDRWLLNLPYAHVGGLSILFRCLAARRTVVLPDSPKPGSARRFDPQELATCIERDRITLLSLVPSMLERLLTEVPEWRAPPHLRAALIGGGPCMRDLVPRAHARGLVALPTYGMTETCSQVATRPLDAEESYTESGAIGPPLSNVEVRSVDGEIQVRGPSMMTRYVTGAGPEAIDDGWYRTGDAGRLDERGWLHVTGRLDALIVTGGENVHPETVETVLQTCPGIREACVVGLPDRTYGQALAALLVVDQRFDQDATASFANERLASFRKPRRFRVVPSLPKRPTGKLDRPAAKQLADVTTSWIPL